MAKSIYDQIKSSMSSAKGQSTSSVDSRLDALNQNFEQMNRQRDYTQQLSNNYIEDMYNYASLAGAAQEEANRFNAEQAGIQRDWSEAMSATAHQREVKDLKAAGLNPVISAYGSGASVGSGAAASSSNSLTGVFGSLASSAINAVSNMASAMDTNATSIATNSQNAYVQQYVSELTNKTNMTMNQANLEMQKYLTRLNNLTSEQVSRIAAGANVSSAAIHAAASNYAAEVAYNASIETARMNNKTAIQTNRESTSATFQGFATSYLKKAAGALTDYLTGQGAYAIRE